jgi:phosphatidylserine/phosphatidylglycerophosphate/cardiolipin synthase-like enzyme
VTAETWDGSTRLSVVDAWFLTPKERGNPATGIDRRRSGERAWTAGNDVTPIPHGRHYFATLLDELLRSGVGDLVYLADWRGDGDERLGSAPGTELATVLARLASIGVDVRGLIWRSHADSARFSEHEHIELAERVNKEGAEVLLDERVRRAGSHHQKLVLIRRTTDGGDVAFVGGIDLCHGRRDDEHHHGDPQPIPLGRRYGPRPAWHDVQLELRGPAIGDLEWTFRERWEDPTPLDHRNPVTARVRRMARQPRRPNPLQPMREDPAPAGDQAVQVLRTYPKKRPPYPFAPDGERSIARAYAKVLTRARALIYVEDQYLWSNDVADQLAAALRRSPDLHLIALIPRFPDQDGAVTGAASRIGRKRALERVIAAGGSRVGVYDAENDQGVPVYVHAKVFIVDDVWAAVGSDNLNRRSWTHDSELSCAVIDTRVDDREPRDPGGLGDGARTFARDLRLRLWREHLGTDVAEQVLLEPSAGFAAWEKAAAEVDDWHRRGRYGQHPAARIRRHHVDRVPALMTPLASALYRTLVDPDGRPWRLRRRMRL